MENNDGNGDFYGTYIQTNYPKRNGTNRDVAGDVRGREGLNGGAVRPGDGKGNRTTGTGNKSDKGITRKKIHASDQRKIVTCCPYCGTAQMVQVNGVPGSVAVTCDIYSNGCEKVFVVSFKHVILTETKTVEGEK